MKKILPFILLCLSFTLVHAQETDSTQLWIDEIENSLKYETGVIELESGNATLTVPDGFRFLNKEQAMYVLSDLWSNPRDSTVMGLLVPADRGVLESKSWVFTIEFDEMGYVSDDDAEDMDYDELLKEGQKETREANPERIKQGYRPIEFIGWAAKPFYDKDKKILHWAKEFKFGDDSTNTLNYNLRILGRKGIFMLNAVAPMSELPVVKAHISDVLGSVVFKEGHRYSDYIPDVDEVAAWTVGGLVAGKILAKVGFFTALLKFWKIIAVGIAGAGGAIWKRLRGKRNEEV